MPHLWPREKEIAELLLLGCDNAEIAKQLRMANRTVKAHFNRMFKKYGLGNFNGIKRVKLAVLLYREQRKNENAESSNCAVHPDLTASAGAGNAHGHS